MVLTLTAFHLAVLLAAALLLLAAAVSDARHYRIPNIICALLVLLFPVFVVTAPRAVEWEQHLIVFTLVLISGFAMFLASLAGAGDIKLLAATGLWAGPHLIAVFLITTALAGGVLALAVGCRAFIRKLRRSKGRRVEDQTDAAAHMMRVPIPYGIAIATGGLSVIYRLSQPLLFPG